jgi:hypothetical protein
MPQQPIVQQVFVDLRRNMLTLELDRPLELAGAHRAIMEIGAYGRLHGLEIDGTYLTISDPDPDPETSCLTREIALTVTVSPEGNDVVLGRRGPGWELSFPSGNQCWQVRSGAGNRAICAVTLASAAGPD